MKKLLIKHQLSDFYLSKPIYDNPLWYQRAIEFNYPAQLSELSKNHFYLVNSEIAKNCNTIDTINEVMLAQCN